MRKFTKRQKAITLHGVFWVGYASANHFINIINWGNVYVLDTIGKYVTAMLIFYVNALVIGPYIIKKKKYLIFIAAEILLSVLSFGFKDLLYVQVFPLFGMPEGPYTLTEAYILNLWWSFNYGLLGLGYWLAKELISKAEEQHQFEKEKLQLEYAYLKSQINPHFLYNFLNFLYSKSLGVSELLSTGILCLSDILRYMGQNGEDAEGKVDLAKEIHHIESIIKINQLRFDNKLKIQFHTEGDLQGIRIIPFVLITLVENVFKHGKLCDPEDPVIIQLKRNSSNGTLELFLKNRKSANGNKEKSSEIGIKNIRKRLGFIYGDRHFFNINEDLEYYTVNLSIKL